MSDAFDPYLASPDACHTYLEERLARAHEPHKDGFFVLGGAEVMLLWDSVALSFTTRNWIGVVLGAQAMCERGLAAIYDMQDLPGMTNFGRKGLDRVSLGTLLRWAGEDSVLEPEVLGRLQLLCDRRKVLTHWKRPLAPGTLMSRAVERTAFDDVGFDQIQETLLAEDAKLAVDTVFDFCFGDQLGMVMPRTRPTPTGDGSS